MRTAPTGRSGAAESARRSERALRRVGMDRNRCRDGDEGWPHGTDVGSGTLATTVKVRPSGVCAPLGLDGQLRCRPPQACRLVRADQGVCRAHHRFGPTRHPGREPGSILRDPVDISAHIVRDRHVLGSPVGRLDRHRMLRQRGSNRPVTGTRRRLGGGVARGSNPGTSSRCHRCVERRRRRHRPARRAARWRCSPARRGR